MCLFKYFENEIASYSSHSFTRKITNHNCYSISKEFHNPHILGILLLSPQQEQHAGQSSDTNLFFNIRFHIKFESKFNLENFECIRDRYLIVDPTLSAFYHFSFFALLCFNIRTSLKLIYSRTPADLKDYYYRNDYISPNNYNYKGVVHIKLEENNFSSNGKVQFRAYSHLNAKSARRMKKFITKTCPCNELESGTCKRQRYIQEKDFTSYTTNSDCLHMEIHVKSNKKCSSIVCLKKYICNMQNDGPSDNEGSVYGLAISLVFQL
ncbi:hypothetical protein H8356DRAFT_1416675 [Neocallimastix lanati (nom. inval.)]|nr:hypothetical protein H8356DRAFT_1416675 [Neocallimastix sp. JGI-2020a]